MNFDESVSFIYPSDDEITQDQECFKIKIKNEERIIRIHDYHELYEIPGLYDFIVMDKLQCWTPDKLINLLIDELIRFGIREDELKVLDLGAGNGIMGELVSQAGVKVIVGIDILPEAKIAAERDRPSIYSEYFAIDLKKAPGKILEKLKTYRFNCLISASALGFGDIPPEVFVTAYNLIEDGGFVVFNINDKFLERTDESGFYKLINSMIDSGFFSLLFRERYPHRLSITGNYIFYTAFVGRKIKSIK